MESPSYRAVKLWYLSIPNNNNNNNYTSTWMSFWVLFWKHSISNRIFIDSVTCHTCYSNMHARLNKRNRRQIPKRHRRAVVRARCSLVNSSINVVRRRPFFFPLTSPRRRATLNELPLCQQSEQKRPSLPLPSAPPQPAGPWPVDPWSIHQPPPPRQGTHHLHCYYSDETSESI